MGHTLTVDLPLDAYELLRQRGSAAGRSPEDVATEILVAAARAVDEDPLLQLAGVFESDVSDVSARHDEYLGCGLLRDLRCERDG